jgi:hypothetical protein
MRTSLFMLASLPWLLIAPGLALAQGNGYGENAPPTAAPPQGKPGPGNGGAASAPPATLPADHTPGVEETEASCRARRKAYEDSLACFAPYRYGRHVIDIEAFKHCKVVKEPTDCPPAELQ